MPNFSVPDELFEEIAQRYGTPLHLYDERGILKTARALKKAFSWNKGYKEYFAVKALPTPAILRLFKGEGIGLDCSSLTELMLAKAVGITGEDIMFSANEMPLEEVAYANELGAYINLDDITHIPYLQKAGKMPKCVCLRYNPGGDFLIGTHVMGNPGDAKYGMTREQLTQALKQLQALGVKSFGLHAFLSSNTRSDDYYPTLARLLFKIAVELFRETGVAISFVNLSGGIGIPYHPEEKEADIAFIGSEIEKAYDEMFTQQGIEQVRIFTELGRYMTGPHGFLLTRAVHEKNIYKHYIGVDASACDLMRPAMYGAYHHIHATNKRQMPNDKVYDIVGALCENNDKFAIDRRLPQIEIGDLLVIHDTGAHGASMGYHYNGRLHSKEVLLKENGETELIRRAEVPKDFFDTLDMDPSYQLLKEDKHFNG